MKCPFWMPSCSSNCALALKDPYSDQYICSIACIGYAKHVEVFDSDLLMNIGNCREDGEVNEESN